MRELSVHDAIGTVLCHDITQIIPGQSKKALFRKGHVIRPEDVDPLLTVGKEHISVFGLAEGLVHEEEAATRAARTLDLGRGSKPLPRPQAARCRAWARTES